MGVTAEAATIFALSSGQGRAGVAVIRVSGPAAREVLERMAAPCPRPRFATLRRIKSATTGELLDAVAAISADELLILPNNPNVVLAARQVASMTERPVHVVPTRNCAEGVAALLRMDPARSAEENAEAMTAAARAILSLQVTEAVRDATVSGKRVKKGQTMVLDPDDGLLALDSDAHRAVIAAFGRLKGAFEIVEVYYGAEATLEEAEELASRIHEVAPGAEVEVLHGGQPHYRYLISAE